MENGILKQAALIFAQRSKWFVVMPTSTQYQRCVNALELLKVHITIHQFQRVKMIRPKWKWQKSLKRTEVYTVPRNSAGRIKPSNRNEFQILLRIEDENSRESP